MANARRLRIAPGRGRGVFSPPVLLVYFWRQLCLDQTTEPPNGLLKEDKLLLDFRRQTRDLRW